MYSGDGYSQAPYSANTSVAVSLADPPGKDIDDICLETPTAASTLSCTSGGAGVDIDTISN